MAGSVYNRGVSTDKGVTAVADMFNTTKLKPLQETGNEAQDILLYVYNALQAKGYDPITQIVGYIISGDPTYITTHNNARYLIRRRERDEILEEIVGHYLAYLDAKARL